MKLRKQFLQKFIFAKQVKKYQLKYVMYTLSILSVEILKCTLVKKKHHYKEFKIKNEFNFVINL